MTLLDQGIAIQLFFVSVTLQVELWSTFNILVWQMVVNLFPLAMVGVMEMLRNIFHLIINNEWYMQDV
ncbi:hypothetical protein PMA3_08360 [Pseudomonas silesiensis]|uniref:Uncharacterized protein n=1 Tax=Pseudomonas silesiensis TaxID=1853130 RepID=A0A191YQL9_9PSED|nr:hypothetical protein PMA3_08360 [Pseudomonas silesiensis]